MNEHQYILGKSSKKHHFPECTKRRFVRYIDTETDEYLPGQCGRYDRENKCLYCFNLSTFIFFYSPRATRPLYKPCNSGGSGFQGN